MRRLLLVLAAALTLWFLGRALVHALASDETKIRWRVEAMEEGYNTGDVGDVIAPLHADWTHEQHAGLDREMVRAVLAREALQERNPNTRRLARRVDLDEDTLAITVDGDAATLEVVASFSRWVDEAWKPDWTARFHADFVRTDDGWKTNRSRHADISGTQLSR